MKSARILSSAFLPSHPGLSRAAQGRLRAAAHASVQERTRRAPSLADTHSPQGRIAV